VTPRSRRYCSSSGSARGEDGGARLRGELGGEGADAAGGADDEDGVAVGEVERVDGGHRRDGRQRRGAGGRHIDAGGPPTDGSVGGNGDEFRPTAVASRGVRVHEEAEDLVARRVLGHVGADLLDDAGVVAAQGDGVLVLDAHLGEHAGRDGVVHGVDRGRPDAHEHLALAGGRGGQVVAQDGGRAGFVEGDGLHVGWFL
jgi:hypothetical protein